MTIPQKTQPHLDKVIKTGTGRSSDPFDTDSEETWLSRAQTAYYQSTSYVDANYRKHWEDALAAFDNRHSSDSKYNSQLFDKRSRIFRPKTRSVIRKNEASAAAAFFSNIDTIDCRPWNENNPRAKAGADIHKWIMQYRLTRSIPWFQICLGALQDAQTIGVVASRQYWRYETRKRKHAGDVELDEPVHDEPVIELIPIENLRIDPGASWSDPVGSSPFIIQLIPMYVVDIKSRMKQIDDKTGQPVWKRYSDEVISSARQLQNDSTRMQRNKGRDDPLNNEGRDIGDYEIAWVQRHIHRKDGEDYEFYTLGTEAILTKPKLLSETSKIGRDYVIGCAIIETHKPMPNGVPTLVKQVQDEVNEIANQRLDNVKFVLNKRWIVKRGKNVDLNSLIRNVPGSVTLADDPELDVKESTWNDVTGSSYQEQDRLNLDFDDLAGNFSAGSIASNRQLNETVGGLQMLGSGASMMTEYLIRTFATTWVEPVLAQVVKLEAAYETDTTILALAGDKANLTFKYGIASVTDDLLNHDLLVKVNVGMGATDPTTRLQKLVMAVTSYANIVKANIPGLNTTEIGKEFFAFIGYQDGTRFMTPDNPQVVQLTQQVQQLMMMLQRAGMEMQKIKTDHAYKMIQAQAKLGDLSIKQNDQQNKLQIEGVKQSMEREKKALEMQLKQLDVVIKAIQVQLETFKANHEKQMLGLEGQSKREDVVVKSIESAMSIAEKALAASEKRKSSGGGDSGDVWATARKNKDGSITFSTTEKTRAVKNQDGSIDFETIQ